MISIILFIVSLFTFLFVCIEAYSNNGRFKDLEKNNLNFYRHRLDKNKIFSRGKR